MSAAKHTPGPWMVANHFGTPVVCSQPRGRDRVATCYGSRAPQENEANARLIAAAPELLEALREAELVLAEKLRMLGADPGVSPTTRRIRAAIAKATGGAL